MKRIRIMHVIRTMATGGTENGVRKLLCGLNPEWFEQSVCALVDSPDVQVPASVRVICLDRSPDRAAFLIPQLARVFAREQPDVVHSRNWATIEAVAAGRLARVPVTIHSEHGRDLRTMGRQLWRRRVMRRLSYRWANYVFCVSQELKEYYCRELGLRPGVLEVIPNGVDVEKFRPNSEARREVRKSLSAGPGTLVVGTVSRLDPIKDHTTLLLAAERALARGVDLQLVIAGDGSQRDSLEKDLATRPTLAHRTRLLGEVQNVADWLNGFDVFVLPSLSEGMSNTLLEAMAVGLPAVATAVGGNRELIEDGQCGMLVPPKEADRICDCLVLLAGSPEWRSALGRNARDRVVHRFSIDQMIRRYEEIYAGKHNYQNVRAAATSPA